MKNSKKVVRKKKSGDIVSKKLVYLLLVLLSIPITIGFLIQSQSFTQRAQTVPSPACLGPCPSASGSLAPSLVHSTAPCISTAPVSQSQDHDGQNVMKQLLELFIKLFEALLGGSVGNSQPNTASPSTPSATVPSGGAPSIPCPPTTASSSSSSSSAASSTTSAAGACVTPPGMTALLDQDTTDSQKPWKRNGTEKVTINFETKNANAEFKTNMQYSAAAWNKSPCLNVQLVETCQPNTNCVTLTAPDAACSDDGNFDAVETGGFTSGGHICAKSGMSAGENKNVTVHEMGHAVGLVHRKTTHVLMNSATYPDVFDPDDTDYKNLLFDYGSQK